jgi:polyhydroxyalkanoate synthase
LAAATWLNSAAILPALRLVSGNWETSPANPPQDPPPSQGARESLRQRWAVLLRAAERTDSAALAAALQAEGLRRFDRLLTGIERYRHHPRHRTVPEAPVLWEQGTTKLRDYRSARDPKAPRLLVIPSLVNRYYIHDLETDASFLRWCAAQGMAPFVIDWGAPGDAEREFDFADYILRLERALEAVAKEPGGPLFAVGYCMGGNLALALALRRQAVLAGLVLLATPWDFHAENKEHSLMLAEIGHGLEPVLQLFGELPVDLLQVFFSGFDPFQVLRKFQGFGALDPTSAQAQKFVALEDWLNDGTAVAASIARECLIGWYGENRTARNRWLVGGEPVDPAKFARPALSLIPAGDRIVPPKSALALADALPKSDRLLPAAGHIGMMAGRGALPLVWEPLKAWVEDRARA